jgi:hypothetical protein
MTFNAAPTNAACSLLISPILPSPAHYRQSLQWKARLWIFYDLAQSVKPPHVQQLCFRAVFFRAAGTLCTESFVLTISS